MISQKSVQEILESTRIEEVIGDFITLKRRGVNLIGLCPFHGEKSPSFSVNPTRNIFKCFGCGEGGDSVGFLMKHENLTYPDALRYIARKYNIRLEETEQSPEFFAEKQLEESLHIVNERALKFFQTQLFETDNGKSIGLAYFKQRGFREETIKKFGLGFASESRDALTKTLNTEGYSIDLLRKLGLTSKQYDLDFFRNRVMFTIFGQGGKPIAFAGRIMSSDKTQPKYINSPETEVYSKTKTLYGLFQARKAIQQADECLLVEGYTDVISLHQAGVENVVASSGTSLTTEQIRLIKRYTPNIKILYDGDAAGIKAALRGLDMVLEEDMNVRVVLLPQGEDPDSFVQNLGTTAFQAFMKAESADFIFFKTKLLIEDAAGDPVKKSKLVKDIVGSISKIPDPVKRQLYIRECAQLLRVEEAILIGETTKLVRKNLEDKKKGFAAPPSSDIGSEIAQPSGNQEVSEESFADKKAQPTLGGDEFQEKDIARILVSSGGEWYDEEQKMLVAQYVMNNISDVLQYFDNPLYKRIIAETASVLERGVLFNANLFLQHESKDIRDFATTALSTPYEYSGNWEQKLNRPLETQKMPDLNFTKDSLSALKRFKLRKIMKLCEHNAELIRQAGDNSDTQSLMKHLKIQQKLNEMRNSLAAELNTVIFR
jgi:DNA primase